MPSRASKRRDFTQIARAVVDAATGGEPILPEMAMSPRRQLLPGDLLLVCSDGFWANLDEDLVAGALSAADVPLQDTIAKLADQALLTAGPLSDNTSVAVLRFLE